MLLGMKLSKYSECVPGVVETKKGYQAGLWGTKWGMNRK